MSGLFDQDVLGLEVAVYDVELLVQELEAQQHLRNVEARLHHGEPLVLLEQLEELSAGHVVDAEVDEVVVLERVVQLDHERVLRLPQDLFLVQDRLHRLAAAQVFLLQDLYRVDLLVELRPHQGHLAEAASTEIPHELEVSER